MIQVSHSVNTRVRLLLIPQDVEAAIKHHPLSDVQGHTGTQDPCRVDEDIMSYFTLSSLLQSGREAL
jgi:hypothetical protein